MANPTFNDTYNAIYANSAILNQVTIAILAAVRAVFTESAGTTDHANRLTWATRAVKDPQTEAKAMIVAVATDATIQTTLPTPGPTDAQVQTAVNGLVNVYADNAL